MRSSLVLLAALASCVDAAYMNKRQTSSAVPDYFQTTPQVFAGPTPTGSAPFLVQTNPAPFGAESSFVPNTPLETALPIVGNTNNTSIFTLLGQLSSYFPNPVGFGANEYPLPPGANVTLVNVLHRHGARYPTSNSSVATFGAKLYNITNNGTAKWSGALSFINNFKYSLGAEILVPRGRQELFDSGVLFYYNYGRLYNTSTKIVARTTTQDRMLKSAEYFMAGFFGLSWTNNVTLEPIIEQLGFNNSLAGYYQCNNSENYISTAGTNASALWEATYLKNARQRLSAMSGGYNWTTSDAYGAQQLCAYETVAFGYSAFCTLFTFEEWQGYEYSVDMQFHGNDGFGSPTGRAVGIGWVEELYARLQGHLYNLPAGATQVNATLDEQNSSFPLNQTLYFDFSHDTNIMSILTAMGLTQFNQSLPATGPPANQQLIVSHMEPFGARFVVEVIKTPHPVKATRPANSTTASMADYYDTTGNATTYVHFLLNQRTIPLSKSYAACAPRDDGWCEMNAFFSELATLLDTARYEYSCFAHYPATPYGNVTNGVPTVKRALGGGMGSGLVMRRDSDAWHI